MKRLGHIDTRVRAAQAPKRPRWRRHTLATAPVTILPHSGRTAKAEIPRNPARVIPAGQTATGTPERAIGLPSCLRDAGLASSSPNLQASPRMGAWGKGCRELFNAPFTSGSTVRRTTGRRVSIVVSASGRSTGMERTADTSLRRSQKRTQGIPPQPAESRDQVRAASRP